jgi:hypothetical protein
MIQDTGTTPGSGLNIQVAAEGFGSYLQNILPPDVALAAGAFSATMQQIRNINKTNIEQFAQIVPNLETIKGLSQVNGTGVPTNEALNTAGLALTALGSGPKGTYTMSDLFGSMSGLPYPWKNIQADIQTLQTTKLSNIYNQLFLAVTWEKANCTIVTVPYYVNVQQYIANASNPNYPAIDPVNPYLQCGSGSPTTNPTCQPRIDTLYYTVVITEGSDGGGYGRGTASAPTVALSPNNCGASVTLQIGTNDANAGSQGGGTFGRVTQFTINNGSAYNYGTATNSSNNSPPNQSSGPYAPPVETITVQAPPTATLAVTAGGAIATGGTNTTGDTYRSVGSTTIGTTGWPSPMNDVVQAYVDQANAEISVIYNTGNPAVRNLNTMWNSTGIQLTIEQRTRYTAFSPVPDPKDEFVSQYPVTLIGFVDSIPQLSKNTLPHMQSATLEAISNWDTIGGQSLVAQMRQERNQDRLEKAGIQLDNNIPDRLNPVVAKILQANGTVPLANPLAGVPADTNCGPYTTPSLLSVSVDGNTAVPTPAGYYNQVDDTFYNVGQVADSYSVYGNMLTVPNCTDPVVVGDLVPIGPGLPEDTGGPRVTGSLAGSDYQELIPPNLNTNYTGGSLISSGYSVNEAIDEVIKCNCDCWVA